MSANNFAVAINKPIRHVTHCVQIKNGQNCICVGGNHPVVVQSMTNTLTSDIHATVDQVYELACAGSELVRLTVNTPQAAMAVPEIRSRLDDLGCYVPLIGDFHYNGHLLLSEYPECAKALSKYRINPGNIGQGDKKQKHFAQMIDVAIRYDKPVRIGVNWGSLDQELLESLRAENAKRMPPYDAQAVMFEALIRSVLNSAEQAVNLGLPKDHIIISCKLSGVEELISVYQQLAKRSNYALHLGLTEAGGGTQGIVASSSALSILLQMGIGDTIRVSLTPSPQYGRTQEVIVAQQLLQCLAMRYFSATVISCPGCGRTSSDRFQKLADSTERFLREQMPVWREQYKGVANMTVAVMGCIVNGPGESRHANIGISLPGNGESPAVPVYADGQKIATLRGEDIEIQFQSYIMAYIKSHYAGNR